MKICHWIIITNNSANMANGMQFGNGCPTLRRNRKNILRFCSERRIRVWGNGWKCRGETDKKE